MFDAQTVVFDIISLKMVIFPNQTLKELDSFLFFDSLISLVSKTITLF